jgi:hypothetical protein
VIEPFLACMEIALLLALPLGMVDTLLHFKRTGIFTVFLDKRCAMNRLRRVISVAAACTAALSSLAFMASGSHDPFLESDPGQRIWKAGETTVWALHGDPSGMRLSDIYAFKDDGLDVVSSRWGRWLPERSTLRLPNARVLHGSMDPFLPYWNRKGVLHIAPAYLPDLPERRFGGNILAALNRMIVSGVLLFIAAYLALLSPISRQWKIYSAFFLIVPAVCTGMLWCSIQLWIGAKGACGMEVVWLTLLAAIMFSLDRVFVRYGLRM